MGSSQVGHSGHNGQSFHQTSWSFCYGSSGYGIHFGSGVALSWSILRVCFSYGKIEHWSRECPNTNWLFRQSQHTLPTSLEFLRYAMTVGRMILVVESVLNISWSASWGQLIFLTKLALQGFFMTVERLDTSLESVPSVGILVIHPVQISFIVL